MYNVNLSIRYVDDIAAILVAKHLALGKLYSLGAIETAEKFRSCTRDDPSG